MKKFLICLLLSFVIPSFIFATTLSKKDQLEISNVGRTVKTLSSSEAMWYVEQNKMANTVPVLLNALVGGGLGSFIQGDTVGGSIALGGDVLGSVFLISGYSKMINSTLNNDSDIEGVGAVVGGCLILTAAKVFEVVRPFLYTKEYNNQLQTIIIPTVTNTGDVGATIGGKISF